MSNYLYHHGIKGQKWGIRRYQNEDGTLTELGKKRLQVEDYENTKTRFDKIDRDELNSKLDRLEDRLFGYDLDANGPVSTPVSEKDFYDYRDLFIEEKKRSGQSWASRSFDSRIKSGKAMVGTILAASAGLGTMAVAAFNGSKMLYVGGAIVAAISAAAGSNKAANLALEEKRTGKIASEAFKSAKSDQRHTYDEYLKLYKKYFDEMKEGRDYE